MNDGTCKTCAYWTAPTEDDRSRTQDLCRPLDPDTYEPMERGFEVRVCKQPTQAFCESPVERNGFALADGSTYFAVLATAEDFGCVRWEKAQIQEGTRELAGDSERKDALLRQALKALEEWRDQNYNNADADLIAAIRAEAQTPQEQK